MAADQTNPTSETITTIAQEILGDRVLPEDVPAITGLVGALLGEMTAMRKLPVGEHEPATTYKASS